MKPEVETVRPGVAWAMVVCLAVAMAPWMAGGREPLAMFVSAAALLVGLALAWLQPAVVRLKTGPLVWAYGALVAWGGLSLLWSANRFSTWLWLVPLVLAGLAFRLAYVIAGQAGGRQRVIWAYLVSVALVVGYGLYFYLTESYGRFVGPFYWPNAAAIYLVPAVILCVDGLRRPGWRAWAWWSGLAVAGVALVLADSRATMLVLAVVLAVYLLVQRWGRRQWGMLALAVALVLVLSNGFVRLHQVLQPGNGQSVTTAAPGSRYGQLLTSQSGSDRLYYWRSALQIWWDRPVGGTGAGTYGDVHPYYQGRVVSASQDAHNFYVQTLAELGLVGAILLSWLLLVLLGGVARGLLRVGNIGLPVTLGLVAVLLHAGLDMDFRYPALLMLTAVWAALVYGQGRPRYGRLGVWPVVLAGVAVVVAFLIYGGQTWMARGYAAEAAQNYEPAAEHFAQAQHWLIYDPAAVEAEGVCEYSLALLQPNQRAAFAAMALERARTAERLDPANAQPHQLEGWALGLRRDMPGAERVLRSALKLDPYNQPDYAHDLANVLEAQGRVEEGLTVAQQMLAQYPPAVVSNRSIDPRLAPSLANLWVTDGALELELGRADRALAAAGQARALDPGNRGAATLVRQADAREQ